MSLILFYKVTKSNNSRDFNKVPVYLLYLLMRGLMSLCLSQIFSCISSTARWSRTGSSFTSVILMLALCLGTPMLSQHPHVRLILLLWLAGPSHLFLLCSTPIPYPRQTLSPVGVGCCPYLMTLIRGPHHLGCPGPSPPRPCCGRTFREWGTTLISNISARMRDAYRRYCAALVQVRGRIKDVSGFTKHTSDHLSVVGAIWSGDIWVIVLQQFGNCGGALCQVQTAQCALDFTRQKLAFFKTQWSQSCESQVRINMGVLVVQHPDFILWIGQDKIVCPFPKLPVSLRRQEITKSHVCCCNPVP